MAQNLADLREATSAVNLRHQLCKRVRVGHPFRGATLCRTAEVDQLHVEPADRLYRVKHVGLERQRHVPCRLPAHGRVHGEDQPPTPRAGPATKLLHAANEISDVCVTAEDVPRGNAHRRPACPTRTGRSLAPLVAVYRSAVCPSHRSSRLPRKPEYQVFRPTLPLPDPQAWAFAADRPRGSDHLRWRFPAPSAMRASSPVTPH